MEQDQKLDIIYKDDHFIAVNKPAGLLVHRSPIDRRAKKFAVQMVRNQIGQQIYPVHRLDRPTSGVLIFALNSETAKKTASLFQSGEIVKKYVAVVRGYIPEQGTVDHSLKEIPDKYIQRQKGFAEKVYPAVTEFKRRAIIELPVAVDKYPTSRYSLVELFPKTGRRHQLRRHMKHLSHPIIGDTRYGKTVHNKFFKNRFGCYNLLLSATEMRFVHPKTGAETIVSAPVSPNFSAILSQFNWNFS